ncbi:MAG: zinc ribbon domain-containing protein [Solobacterium sp.]|nr:zinc ribbon domain-containing protein [Solobacterium sp.]
MYCPSCGKPIINGNRFCTYCGRAVPAAAAGPVQGAPLPQGIPENNYPNTVRQPANAGAWKEIVFCRIWPWTVIVCDLYLIFDLLVRHNLDYAYEYEYYYNVPYLVALLMLAVLLAGCILFLFFRRSEGFLIMEVMFAAIILGFISDGVDMKSTVAVEAAAVLTFISYWFSRPSLKG